MEGWERTEEGVRREKESEGLFRVNGRERERGITEGGRVTSHASTV